MNEIKAANDGARNTPALKTTAQVALELGVLRYANNVTRAARTALILGPPFPVNEGIAREMAKVVEDDPELGPSGMDSVHRGHVRIQPLRENQKHSFVATFEKLLQPGQPHHGRLSTYTRPRPASTSRARYWNWTRSSAKPMSKNCSATRPKRCILPSARTGPAKATRFKVFINYTQLAKMGIVGPDEPFDD